MKWVILPGKAVMLLFWLAELANLFKLVSPPWDGVLHTAVSVVLAVHLVGATLFTRAYAALLLEPKLHKMLIMFFGVFHWLDLRQKGRLRRPIG